MQTMIGHVLYEGKKVPTEAKRTQRTSNTEHISQLSGSSVASRVNLSAVVTGI